MKEDTKIFINGGVLVDPKFYDGMWRVSVEGKNFYSPTKEGLLSALGFFYSAYTSDEPIREPEPTPAQKLWIRLTTSSSLEEKQQALKGLERLPDDQLASQTVATIKRKPTSFGASYLTKVLNKSDFVYVTHIEISENVGSVIHRAELLQELGERIKV